MPSNRNVWRDKNGVCHAQSADTTGACEMLGYAHGRDRCMQIVLMRILGQGRASELLNASDDMLGIDTFFRRMNWNQSVAGELEKLTPQAMGMVEAYCAGVNRAMAESIPWESKLLGFRPEPWRPADIILFSRMVGYLTLSQSQGEMERFFIELVQAGVDEARLHALFPGILGGLDLDLVRKINLQERLVAPSSLWNLAAPLMMASNNWAVSGGKTASQKPILANDPHLEVNRLPNVWYEIVLTTPDTSMMGATMPGLPAVLVGRNPDLAWSATYTFMDGTDSWIERCRNGEYYREPGKWLPFDTREEVIKRKKKDPVRVVFYENSHGVLEGDPHVEGYYLTTAWAPGRSGAETLNNIFTMFTAKTVADGMAALGSVETSWNWVLADREGNIGYQMSGLMPKRRDGISGFVPLPGWEAQNDWQGFHSAEDLPRCLNPDCGYFVTANQDLNAYGKVNPINVGMGPYRSDRIGDLLSENNAVTLEDMYQLHGDVYSKQAEAFMRILMPMLPDTPNGDILKAWDFEYTAESEGACLFERFYRELYRRVFGEDGFGEAAVDCLREHTGIFNDFYINFDRVLLAETSVWFGDRTREDIYRQAAEKALAEPPERWGYARKVVMKNILFDGKLPRFLGFDRGPITIVGNLATPHQGQIFESANRLTTFAPSLRMVTDLSTGDLHTNLAGGPSDRRFSRWYVSYLENWTAGRYKKLSADAEKAYDF
jgi:penicillin amidase